MSHGFSRFGNPSARERFHAQERRGGALAMFLPTILATLFLFTAVIALNKLTSLSKEKTIRLINVDDVFPDPVAVEKNSTKEYWETPPPPAPEQAVNGGTFSADLTVPVLAGETPAVAGVRPETTTVATPRPIQVGTTDIRMPDVKPDTSLPGPLTP